MEFTFVLKASKFVGFPYLCSCTLTVYTIYKVIYKDNSEKCTGAFKFRCRVIFYLCKSRKSGLISHPSIEFPQKIFILFFNFITNINICKIILKNNFISIILNLHNDPCFEDMSLSLTLKYRPVHFSESSCM